MTDSRIVLLENKLNTTEVLLMSLIQAVGLLVPGAAQETIGFIQAQAAAAQKRGDQLAYVLLTSAADRVSHVCALPGPDEG